MTLNILLHILALDVFITFFLIYQFINKNQGAYVAMEYWKRENNVIVEM